MRALGFLAGLVGLAMVMAACGGGSGSPSAGNSASTGGDSLAVTVSASEFKFEPASISAKNGQEVTVTLSNKGAVAHDFTLSEFGAKSALTDPTKSTTVKFTPNKTGTFTFICSVPGHEAAGMKGEVKVS